VGGGGTNAVQIVPLRFRTVEEQKKKRQKFHAGTNFFFFHPCPVPVFAVAMPYII
jgi:hypothetical protein